jgi:hypothetical protein
MGSRWRIDRASQMSDPRTQLMAVVRSMTRLSIHDGALGTGKSCGVLIRSQNFFSYEKRSKLNIA